LLDKTCAHTVRSKDGFPFNLDVRKSSYPGHERQGIRPFVVMTTCIAGAGTTIGNYSVTVHRRDVISF